jgi:hypothetical protein
MSGRLTVDFGLWDDHAKWWEGEAANARERMGVDDATIEQAMHAFGKIGSSTVGAAYAAVLAERRAAGERLGAYAQNVATHIRANLQTYRDREDDNQRLMST